MFYILFYFVNIKSEPLLESYVSGWPPGIDCPTSIYWYFLY